MEAVGPEAGSVDDTFNRAKAFVNHSRGDSIKSQHSQSCVLMAFDLPREPTADVATRAYLITIKAEQIQQSRLYILSEAIRSLESGELEFPIYYDLEHLYVV